MKIDPYYPRQKCRPMNLVSGNIRFMGIFAGVPLGAGVKESGVVKIRNFQPITRCISVTVQDRTKVTIND